MQPELWCFIRHAFTGSETYGDPMTGAKTRTFQVAGISPQADTESFWARSGSTGRPSHLAVVAIASSFAAVRQGLMPAAELSQTPCAPLNVELLVERLLLHEWQKYTKPLTPSAPALPRWRERPVGRPTSKTSFAVRRVRPRGARR